jgi:hypothetical protein
MLTAVTTASTADSIAPVPVMALMEAVMVGVVEAVLAAAAVAVAAATLSLLTLEQSDRGAIRRVRYLFGGRTLGDCDYAWSFVR